MFAFSPNGTKILGTYERVPGVATVAANSFVRKDDGMISIDHENETTLWWDQAKTQTEAGEVLFVDDEGTTWKASELVLCATDTPPGDNDDCGQCEGTGETQSASNLKPEECPVCDGTGTITSKN